MPKYYNIETQTIITIDKILILPCDVGYGRTRVDSIGVRRIDRSENGNAFNDDVSAIHWMNIPCRRIDDCDVRDLNVFREHEFECVRSRDILKSTTSILHPPVFSLSVDCSVVTLPNKYETTHVI